MRLRGQWPVASYRPSEVAEPRPSRRVSPNLAPVPETAAQRSSRRSQELQRRAVDRRPLQAPHTRDRESPVARARAFEASDRFRQRADVRTWMAPCNGSPTRSFCSRRPTSRCRPRSERASPTRASSTKRRRRAERRSAGSAARRDRLSGCSSPPTQSTPSDASSTRRFLSFSY